MGVSGAFLTGDLFNLYVWFEVMLVASFVLMALHRTRAQIEGAFKYVTLNLIASSLFLTALGLLYGGTGTLNMADLAATFRQREMGTFELVLAMLFFTAFGVKAALFPLFFWLPASYHTPPAAVGAVFAGLLTKVGVYALDPGIHAVVSDRSAAVVQLAACSSRIDHDRRTDRRSGAA